MSDLAKTFMIGRLTGDMELQNTTGGTALGKFSIAVNRYAGPGKDEQVSFFNCTLWGKQAEGLCQYMTKGTRIAVEAEPIQNRWQDQEGNNRNAIQFNCRSVQLLGSPNGNNGGGNGYGGSNGGGYASAPAAQPAAAAAPAAVATHPEGGFEDDIPF